jgi:hypothetical protein
VSVPPEPLRWPLVRSVCVDYEASDRAYEQARRPGLAPRAFIAGYGAYTALGRATRSCRDR